MLLFVMKGTPMKSMQSLTLLLTTCGLAIATAPSLASAQELSVTPDVSAAPLILAQDTGTEAGAEGEAPLTIEEATERLSSVPVFSIVSEDNSPVLANIEQEGQEDAVQLVSFWLDHTAAQAALDNIREANPEVGEQARLIPIALSEALRVARSEQEEGGEIAFRVWPDTQTLETATTMLNDSGESEEPVESFPGIPVFYGESQDGVLTIEANGSEVVPFFFDRNDLAATLERAGSGDNAAVVDRTQIRVTSLNQVVNSMIAPGSETNASKIEFVPSRTSLEYVQQEFPDTLQE